MPEFGTTPGRDCRERGLGRFLGRTSTAALAEEARVASNSVTVRVIRPDAAVTMDRRENRLNLRLDRAGKIVTALCF